MMNDNKLTYLSSNAVLEQEINFDDLINEARQAQAQGKYSEALLKLDLITFSPTCDFQHKILAYTIKSFIYTKTGELHLLRRVASKFINKYFESYFSTEIEAEIENHYIKVLYRAGQEEAKSPADTWGNKNTINFISCMMYWKAYLFIKDKGESETRVQLTNQILDLYQNSMEEVKLYLKEKENFFEENKGRIIDKFHQALSNTSASSNDLKKDKFIVSKVWFEAAKDFISKLKEPANTRLSRVYERQYVLQLYFNISKNLSSHKCKGCYPGPINNYSLVDFKHSASNEVFLQSNLSENEDFVELSEEFYKILKQFFGSYLDIKCNNQVTVDKNQSNTITKVSILVSGDDRKMLVDWVVPRSINLNKFSTLSDILNQSQSKCTNSGLNLSERSVKIYRINKEGSQKSNVQSMICSFICKANSHKLQAEEIETGLSTEIQGLNLCSKDILVFDIYDKGSKAFIQLGSDDLVCSFCDSPLEETRIKCKGCSQIIYCSEECMGFDKAHALYHSTLGKFYKKRFELNDIIYFDLLNLLKDDCRRGKTGLRNLGNTCFMNSSLQCLSHCEDLTKYFLIKSNDLELNKQNKYGSGGSIALAYQSLLKDLWQGNSNYLSPLKFREIFVSFVKQFIGFSQHDSHEMLTFMLDTLHEDLNRIKSKPYQELDEKKEVESDKEASERWWLSHLKRENSIIVDLFHGQYKSVIECPKCGRISTNYDPFMFLPLQIPNNLHSITFTILSLDGSIQYIKVGVEEDTTISQLKSIIANRLDTQQSRLLSLVLDHTSKLIVKSGIEKTKVIKVYENKYELAYLFNNFGECNIEMNQIVYILPVKMHDSNSSFETLHYPLPIVIKTNQSIADLKIEVFKRFRRLLKRIESTRNATADMIEFTKKEDDITFMIKEVKTYFGKGFEQSEDDDLVGNVITSSNQAVKLHIYNNTDKVTQDKSCYFCGRANCKFCEISLLNTDNVSKSLLAHMKDRNCTLLFQIEENAISDTAKMSQNLLYYNKFDRNPSNPTLYDCLELFRKTEKLEQDNTWYCNKCKEHQEAFKTLMIFRAPLYLIIQLKRFKASSSNLMIETLINRKNNAVVDFPITDFDISNYVVGKSDSREEFVYDLIAVSQHYGGMSGGHYTAAAQFDGEWSKFDDERVYSIRPSDVIDESAYLLFYKKKIKI